MVAAHSLPFLLVAQVSMRDGDLRQDRNFMLALFMPEHSKQGIAPDLCKLLSSQHDAIEYEFQVALEMKEKF